MTVDHAQWQRTLKAIWERYAPPELLAIKSFPVIPLPPPDPRAICFQSGPHPGARRRCPRHGKVCL